MKINGTFTYQFLGFFHNADVIASAADSSSGGHSGSEFGSQLAQKMQLPPYPEVQMKITADRNTKLQFKQVKLR